MNDLLKKLQDLYISPRWILWGVGGLLVAGIIHVAIVLSVPAYVPHSPYERVGGFGADRSFQMLPPILPRSEPLPDLDPSMRHAICRYSLENGPLIVSAVAPSPFWSLGLFNEKGQVTYSLNDKTSEGEAVRMLVLTPQQLSILRENPPEDLEEMIVVETNELRGFALFRAFAPSNAYLPQISAALRSATCSDLPKI
ncbi:hypothetical protein PsW64_02254 [Pseudovibrio sp. W64]|uniref:DUF1254 domain-containing protein n=1 Tax=unclassified Pseudovibrio TaxID=2627060 RepID=UPI0007AE9A47|nr:MULTISPECIES: hypothetical protein [unclassified Pseudovibrio]KZK81666.1 hypothetical protein PsW64_02254 [Pseudovibrio sp. W64]KZK86376.1 hypothetical protein PsAD46_02763 [Pseudovibrio sp. Ad46]